MRSDENFSPDTVDDQIDQLTSLSQSAAQFSNARVVHALSAYYEEEIRSTEHVWERLSPYISKDETSVQKVHKQKDILDRVADSPSQQQKRLELLLPRSTPPSRPALVAATLFVALLVGSLLWVLQIAHSTQVGHESQTTTTAHGIYISKSDALSKLDLQTGKPLWHTLNQNHGQYNLLYEPVLIGNVVYNVEGSNILVALNAGDGKVRWSRTFNSTIVPGQMFLYASEGSLYFMSFRQNLAGALVKPEQVVLYELNPANGTIKAAYKPPHTGWDSPRVVDHILYYMVGSNLYAEQLPTEKLLWHVPTISQTGLQLKKMFIQNSRVYIMANVTDSQALGYTQIDAFDAHTGKMLWRSSQISQDMKILVSADTMVYMASYGGSVYALEAYTGKLVWQKSFETSDLLATSDTLYLSYNIQATGNHGFLALRAKDGATLWQKKFSFLNDFSMLTLLNGTLYGLSQLNGGNASRSDVLYAFDAHTGSLNWNIPLDSGAVEIA